MEEEMKDSKLLPLAKQIYVDGMDEPYYPPLDEHENEGFMIPGYLFILAFILIFVLVAADKKQIALACFGLFFFFFGLSGGGRRRIGIRNFIPNLKKNTIFPIAGLIVFCIGAFGDLEKLDDQTEMNTGMFAVFFFGVLILLFLGRLTFLLIKASAISKRKQQCTYLVTAVLHNYEDPENTAKLSGYSVTLVGDPIYKYQYHGMTYKFPIIDNVPARFDRNTVLELYIDPDQPERFYEEQIFSMNARRIKLLLQLAGILGGLTIAVAILAYFAVFYLE